MNKCSVTTQQLKAYAKKGMILGILVMILLVAFLFWTGQDAPPPIDTEKLDDKAPLYDLTRSVEDKSLWLFQAQNQLLEQQKQVEKIQQELEALKKGVPSKTDNDVLKTRLDQLEQRHLEQTACSSPANPSSLDLSQKAFQSEPVDKDSLDPLEPLEALSTKTGALTNSIFSATLSLTQTEESALPHKDRFIPPGTYAEAILLSGVDVSAGVSSQASPKPALLRLLDKGSLPNNTFGQLKDCRLIAAAYGDLSSERVYMRLEKLSCVAPDGSVIVTDVEGSVVSQKDNKNGLPGKVVMRDTSALTKSFMGGLFSGLGKAVSQSYTATSLSPFGAMSASHAKGFDLLKQAGGQGTGDAFELLAKYNVQRAEQYQPVIQVEAAQLVDVIFHSGSQFGEKRLRKPVAQPEDKPPHSLTSYSAYQETSHDE